MEHLNMRKVQLSFVWEPTQMKAIAISNPKTQKHEEQGRTTKRNINHQARN